MENFLNGCQKQVLEVPKEEPEVAGDGMFVCTNYTSTFDYYINDII